MIETKSTIIKPTLQKRFITSNFPNAKKRKNTNRINSNTLTYSKLLFFVESTKICSYSLTPELANKINKDPIANAVHKQ